MVLGALYSEYNNRVTSTIVKYHFSNVCITLAVRSFIVYEDERAALGGGKCGFCLKLFTKRKVRVRIS